MLFRSFAVLVLAAGMTAGLAEAQITAGGRALVSNPFLQGDPTPAAEIGEGMRSAMSKIGKLEVISRQTMNSALEQFGYGADASLNEATNKALAGQFKAKVLVTAQLEDLGNGQYKAVAKMSPLAGGSPVEVSLSQGTGQNLADFGSAIAQELGKGLN